MPRLFEMMHRMLPYHYQTRDTNHLTLAYLVISGLDILSSLDRVDKDAVAAWVLSLQANSGNKAELNNGQFYGFRGSQSSHFHSDNNGDWRGMDREKTKECILKCQSYDGGFGMIPGSESHGMQLAVDSKGELTSLVTHAFNLCFDKGSMLVQGWGSFEDLRRIQVDSWESFIQTFAHLSI